MPGWRGANPDPARSTGAATRQRAARRGPGKRCSRTLAPAGVRVDHRESARGRTAGQAAAVRRPAARRNPDVGPFGAGKVPAMDRFRPACRRPRALGCPPGGSGASQGIDHSESSMPYDQSRGLDRDCDLASRSSGFKVAHGIGHLVQWKGTADVRGDRAGLNELRQPLQVGVVLVRQLQGQPLPDEG